MDKAILKVEVQEFIWNNLTSNLSRLILKGSPFPEVSISAIANQISGLKRAKKKLPSWFKTQEIIYPPNLNLEQTSSEITAKYKASLISGEKLIDLTGGFGIDSYFFAEKFELIVHCELDPELSDIATHNFKILGKENITTIAGNGIDFLKASPNKFDCIYLDPARRDDYGGKVFLLEQCTPNVPEFLDLFLEKADVIMIKTSPLLDLKAGINELKNVAEIHIVSVNNEVKELLWIIHNSTTEKTQLKTVNFLKDEVQQFEAEYPENSAETPLSLPQQYLFEPNPAIMKSGMFNQLSRRTNTRKLHLNSHLFTSHLLLDFPGRRFKINSVIPYNKKGLKKYGLKKANITTRNFPKNVAEIRKETKIIDGGDSYLFFTTNLHDEKIVLICEKA